MVPSSNPPSGEEWRAHDGSDVLGRLSPADDDALRAARAGIEAHRKCDVALRLAGPDGRPLAGTTVEVVLRRHAFPFGDQLWGLDAFSREGAWDADRARYWRALFRDMFNAANALCYWTERPANDASKTEDFQGEPRLEHFACCVEWALSQGLFAKGHPLFWSIPKCVPAWVRRYDSETFWKFAEVRVRSLVARFRGRVRIWDAVNEALWEATPEHLGQRAWPHIEPADAVVAMVSRVLRWCRDEDPDATYVLNDYGTESANETFPEGSDGSAVTSATQRARFIAIARALADAGTPPGALGLQSHTGAWIAPAEQRAVYDEYAAGTGLPLHVTEFWASLDRLRATGRYSEETLAQAQAEHIRNFLTVAFGHPSVEAFFFWGFLGAATRWNPHGSGHDTLPLWESVHRLLHEEWTTRLTLRTDADGRASFRGFAGDYAVRRISGPSTVGTTFHADGRLRGGFLELRL